MADVLLVDQPTRGSGGGAPGAPERRGPEVGQGSKAHARVELEARPLRVAVDAHDLDLVVVGELTGRHERRADRAADGIGVRYEESDDHGHTSFANARLGSRRRQGTEFLAYTFSPHPGRG